MYCVQSSIIYSLLLSVLLNILLLVIMSDTIVEEENPVQFETTDQKRVRDLRSPELEESTKKSKGSDNTILAQGKNVKNSLNSNKYLNKKSS